ncbi:unnamed protein product, partial [Adineta steineri]
RKWLQGLKNLQWKDWKAHDQKHWRKERIWERFTPHDGKTCYSSLGGLLGTTHIGKVNTIASSSFGPATSLFGASAPTTNIFGASTPTTNPFGASAPTTNIFGTCAPTTSSSASRCYAPFSFGTPLSGVSSSPGSNSVSLTPSTFEFTTTTCFCDDNVVS